MDAPITLSEKRGWIEQLISLAGFLLAAASLAFVDVPVGRKALTHLASQYPLLFIMVGPAVVAVIIMVAGVQNLLLRRETWVAAATGLTRTRETLFGVGRKTWRLDQIAVFAAEGQSDKTFTVEVTFNDGKNYTMGRRLSEVEVLQTVGALNALIGRANNVGSLHADSDGRLVLPATLTWKADRALPWVIFFTLLFVAPIIWLCVRTFARVFVMAPNPVHPWMNDSLRMTVGAVFCVFAFVVVRGLWNGLRTASEIWTLDLEGVGVARTNMLLRRARQAWRYDEVKDVKSRLSAGKYGRNHRVRMKMARGGWQVLPPLQTEAEANLVIEALRRLAGL